ncbi:nucleolar protein 8 [Pseudohyphozyma bogoriensis]|nr:nucleolar protein 8 [Pseudohyphozyma bogoriensis]
MAAEVSQHRLHLSGLAPSIKPLELVNRFSSFGTIVGGEAGVSGLGVDGNGFPKPFAFITLEATDAQLKRCTSMLSGSLWKGHKLRIAAAKPDYQARLAEERREALEPETPKKKRKRNPDPSVGVAARNFELVTVDNAKDHRGWTIDSTPAPFPIFPILTRPEHPLPAPPPKAAATSWTRERTKAKASKAARAALRDGTAGFVEPLTRARRVRIDPRRWGRKKVVFPAGEGGVEGTEVKGGWECLEPEEGGDGEEVEWVFKGKDGTVRRKEVVRLTQRSRPHTDRFTALLDRIAGGAVEDVEGSGAGPKASTSALLLDEAPDSLETKERPRSASPPPYVPAAPRTLLYNEEDAFALLAATQVGDELEEARKREREAQLKVMLGVLGDEEETKVEKVGGPVVEGFADDDDDDSDLFETLRLRGGCGEEEMTVLRLRGGAADSDDDSDSDDSDDSSDEEEEEGRKEEGEAPKTQLEMGTLKNMFTPQEADGSFSLFSGMELDLEPLERTPSPPPPPHRVVHVPAPAAFVPPPALGRQKRAWVGTGPITSFFPFPSGRFEKKDGEVEEEAVRELGLTEARVVSAKAESLKVLGDMAGGFWKSETT